MEKELTNYEKKIGATTKGRYKKTKIERLGENAMKLVLDSIRKGRSYRDIARTISETYDLKIDHHDVRKSMEDNSQLMVEFRKELNREKLERANLVLDETMVLSDHMERLNTTAQVLDGKMQHASSTKEFVDLAKTASDLAKTSSELIKTFKKITGQFKEGPNIVIDNSKKEVNINASDELSQKLVKQLAKADFKSNIKKVETAEVIEVDENKKNTGNSI